MWYLDVVNVVVVDVVVVLLVVVVVDVVVVDVEVLLLCYNFSFSPPFPLENKLEHWSQSTTL
jgi:hypothetical protein